MSASEPFLPEPPERASDDEARRDLDGLGDDEQPDVLDGATADDPEGSTPPVAQPSRTGSARRSPVPA
ncbi:hypothetical protein [Amnibacterium kyonggiense]